MKLREWIAQVQAGQPLVSPPAPWECAPNVPNPLLAALRLGRLDAFDRLLQAGWDINAGGSLITFCLDQPEKVEFLLSRGARVDVADAFGATDLIRMVLRSRASCLRRLLDLGAQVNHQDREGRAALWLAAHRKRNHCLDLLLEAGADPNLADLEGRIPLFQSANRSILKRLLRAGSDLHHRCRLGRSVWQYFCHRPECLRLLLEHAPPSAVPVTMLLWQAWDRRERGRLEQLLLSRGHQLEVDQPVVRSQTALWWAADLGCRDGCRWLLERGWNPARADRDGRRPVDVARGKCRELLLASLPEGAS